MFSCLHWLGKTLILPIVIRVVYKFLHSHSSGEPHVTSKKPPEAGEILQGSLGLQILRSLVIGLILGDSVEPAGERRQ
jgi:hypothetical protein